jgi:hypothetical protein
MVELVSDEIGYLAEEIPQRSTKRGNLFILIAYSKIPERNNLKTRLLIKEAVLKNSEKSQPIYTERMRKPVKESN